MHGHRNTPCTAIGPFQARPKDHSMHGHRTTPLVSRVVTCPLQKSHMTLDCRRMAQTARGRLLRRDCGSERVGHMTSPRPSCDPPAQRNHHVTHPLN